MALENYTGNIADLVVTNPTPTDPKSQGDDHLRGIKYTLKQSFPNFDGPTTQLPGQVTPDTVTLGDNAPASGNHFWDGSVANQLTLKRGTPGAPGTTVMQVVDGKITALPNAQTWQDVTGSRTWDTQYTNNTSQPITVNLWCRAAPLQYSDILVNDNAIATAQSAAASGEIAILASVVVPVGATYKFEGNATIYKVWELR